MSTRRDHPLLDAIKLAKRTGGLSPFVTAFEQLLPKPLPRRVREAVYAFAENDVSVSKIGGKRPDERLRGLATKAMCLKIAAKRKGERLTNMGAARLVTNDGAMQDSIEKLMKRKKTGDQLRQLVRVGVQTAP